MVTIFGKFVLFVCIGRLFQFYNHTSFFFTSVRVFYCGIIVYIQVFYLKKIEPTSRLAKGSGYFGEQYDVIKKSNSWGVKLNG